MAKSDDIRRWLGACCLVMAAGLLIWGQTVLEPHLAGVGFVLYWLACLIFTLAAILIALLDLRTVRHRAHKEHRKLMEKTISAVDVQVSHQHPPDTKPDERL